MSTILKALRKLQEDRQEKSSIDDLNRSVASKPRRRRRGRAVPILGVVMLLAAGAGAFAMYGPTEEILVQLASYLEDEAPDAPESGAALADARERQAVQQARPPATPRPRRVRAAVPEPAATSEGEPAMGAAAASPPPSLSPPATSAVTPPTEASPAPAALQTASVAEPAAPAPGPPRAEPMPAPEPPPAPAPAPPRAEPPQTAAAAAAAPAPARKRPVASAPAKSPPKPAAKPAAPSAPAYEDEMAAAEALPFPKVVIERLRWHPDPARREARLQLEQAGPLIAHEGDIVAGVLVRRIEPDAVEVQVGSARRLIPLVP